MNLLMVGANKAPGSWDMRGLQLGSVLGARATSAPTSADWQWADLVVLVKHAGQRFAAAAHAAGVPIVWDALDFWRQPTDNGLDETAARGLLQAQIAIIKPALTIGATQAMADAAAGAYLPHHSWKGLEPVQARADGRLCVVYQGNALFLGAWKQPLIEACLRRGWVVEFNPVGELWTADIIVALREGPWDGWMCRQWKSGVKLVNAIAAGRPVITQDSAAMAELGGPGTVISSISELDAALDRWTSLNARREALENCRALAPALRLPAVAERYRTILAGVAARQEVSC